MSSRDSKKDKDWSLLNESERVREKQLRPTPTQRGAYFVAALLTTLAVIRENCFFFFFFFFFLLRFPFFFVCVLMSF